MSKDKANKDSGSWLSSTCAKVVNGIMLEPKNHKQLLDLLSAARKRSVLDAKALAMMEGVLHVSEMQVRDIMIPRANMVVVEREEPLEGILSVVIESAHSRFPVIDDDRSEVVGILLAKDLLAYASGRARRFDIRDLLRSALFVPESKRINLLLDEFQASRNHMAIVVDEYGAASGLVTIEDVLEQIVGEIEDEHDFNDGTAILKRSEMEYTAKAHTPIDEFNQYFGTDFPDDEFDTIAGLVSKALGHMPKRGERVDIGQFSFKVVRADSRRLHLLNIRRLSEVKEEDA